MMAPLRRELSEMERIVLREVQECWGEQNSVENGILHRAR